MHGKKTPGRKPKGYIKLNLDDPLHIAYVIKKINEDQNIYIRAYHKVNKADGVNSGKYKNGHFTKEAKEKTRKNIVKLRYLQDIGQQGGFMTGTRTRGPKPTGYIKLDMKNKDELLIALKVIGED